MLCTSRVQCGMGHRKGYYRKMDWKDLGDSSYNTVVSSTSKKSQFFMAIWYRWCITLYNSAAHVLCTFVYIWIGTIDSRDFWGTNWDMGGFSPYLKLPVAVPFNSSDLLLQLTNSVATSRPDSSSIYLDKLILFMLVIYSKYSHPIQLISAPFISIPYSDHCLENWIN